MARSRYSDFASSVGDLAATEPRPPALGEEPKPTEVKAPAVEESKPPRFFVKDGCVLTTARGALKGGAEVFASDVSSGAEELEQLTRYVRKG